MWTGADRSVCTTAVQGGIQPDGWSGACWAYVGDRFVQFMFGSYPRDQLWRPLAVLVVAVALLIPFMMPKAPRKGLNALLLLVAMPILAYILLLGAWFGLPYVETARWGGLDGHPHLVLYRHHRLAAARILLALGRRSELPVVKTACIVFIELIRGVPLITVSVHGQRGCCRSSCRRARISTSSCARWSASPSSPPPIWRKSFAAVFRPFRRASTRRRMRWA